MVRLDDGRNENKTYGVGSPSRSGAGSFLYEALLPHRQILFVIFVITSGEKSKAGLTWRSTTLALGVCGFLLVFILVLIGGV